MPQADVMRSPARSGLNVTDPEITPALCGSSCFVCGHLAAQSLAALATQSLAAMTKSTVYPFPVKVPGVAGLTTITNPDQQPRHSSQSLGGARQMVW